MGRVKESAAGVGQSVAEGAKRFSGDAFRKLTASNVGDSGWNWISGRPGEPPLIHADRTHRRRGLRPSG
jgi:hypothetical protein